VAAVVIVGTRVAVAHARWAQQLHAELRPVAAGMSGSIVLVVAMASSAGEEILFRSLLMPWLGVWVQAVIFGLLHQTRGRSRWAWMAWATLIGLAFGWIFRLTGSLAGPLVSHFLINAVNLRYLRATLGQTDGGTGHTP
jgi:membrane protease YdiL (CAAX protease family)